MHTLFMEKHMPIVTDAQAEFALTTINAPEAATARASLEHHKEFMKVTLARLKSVSDKKTVADRENDALTQEEYLKLVVRLRDSAEKAYEWENKRKAAFAVFCVCALV